MYSEANIIRGNLNALRREYRRTKNPKLFVALKEQHLRWAKLCRKHTDDSKYNDWTHEFNKRTGYLISTYVENYKYNKISHRIEKDLSSLVGKYLPKRGDKEFEKTIEEHYHWPELGKQPEPATDWHDEVIAINASQLSPDTSGYLTCPAKLKGGNTAQVPFPGLSGIRVPATLDLQWRLEPTNLFSSKHKFKSDCYWRNAGGVVGFLYHPDSGEFLIEGFRNGFHNGAAPALAYNEHGNYPFEEYVRGIYIRSKGTFLIKQKNKKFEKILKKFAFYHKTKLITGDFDKHLSYFINKEFQAYVSDFINYYGSKLEKERGERAKPETIEIVLDWANQPLERFKGQKYCGHLFPSNDPEDWKYELSDDVRNFREALLYYHNFFLDKPSDKYWQVWPQKLTWLFGEAEIDLRNLPKTTGNLLEDLE